MGVRAVTIRPHQDLDDAIRVRIEAALGVLARDVGDVADAAQQVLGRAEELLLDPSVLDPITHALGVTTIGDVNLRNVAGVMVDLGIHVTPNYETLRLQDLASRRDLIDRLLSQLLMGDLIVDQITMNGPTTTVVFTEPESTDPRLDAQRRNELAEDMSVRWAERARELRGRLNDS
jgi:hypothetical protein